MSCLPRALLLASIASVNLSASGLALSRPPDPRNLVLIVPEALPAMGVDQTNAPTLARLKHEGVTFINSHAGFPRLTAEDPFSRQSDLQLQSLMGAAVQQYSAAFVEDERKNSHDPTENLQKVVSVTLPQFKAANRPFLLIYRIAEPKFAPPPPGDARPAYRPAPRAADVAVASIEGALKELGLFESTNIIVAAERTYSRIMKLSNTSRARVLLPREETLGTLPPGFLAIDAAAALQTDDWVINLFDPDNANAFVDWTSGGHTQQGNAIIAAGYDPSKPLLTIEPHGAYSSIYLAETLPKEQRRYVVREIIEAMLEQDYLGGVFVNEKRVGQFPGALSISNVVGAGASGTQPDMVVAFASVTDGCPVAVMCTSVIADTPLPEGEGIPNPFNRAGTWVFMAARGPDFQTGWVDPAPASNGDIAGTVVELMNLDINRRDQRGTRVLTESLAGGRHRRNPPSVKSVPKSLPSVEGLTTQAHLQTLGAAKYFATAVPASVEPEALAYAPRSKWQWPRWKRFTITFEDDEDDDF